MRIRPLRNILALAVIVAASCLPAVAVAEPPALVGKWQLTLPTLGDQAVLILAIDEQQGVLEGRIVDAQDFVADRNVAAVKHTGDALHVELLNKAAKETFTGTVPKEEGDRPIVGTFTFRGGLYPAQLARTEDDKVEVPFGPSVVGTKIQRAVRGIVDPQKRLASLREVVQENAGSPRLITAYGEMLRAAAAAELTADEVQPILDEWLANAQPYGASWVAQTQVFIAAALAKNENYKDLRYSVAHAAATSLPADLNTELRATVFRALIDAATAAGKPDAAAGATAELARLDAILDGEYLENMPPFAVKVFGGRTDTSQNRVVLLELFTGAECPPCVAVDVAFDALLETYKPTELIGLQYHLHIPNSDPLANADAIARSQYYALGGTPSTYFNGAQPTQGGGFMAESEEKYNEFVGIVNKALEGKRDAEIDLKVKRDGKTITIDAAAKVVAAPTAVTASAPPASAAADGNNGKPAAAADGTEKSEKEDDKEPPKSPQYRLRLALVEEAVRYAGGNKLRFHHHVVRAMPGGVEGKELVDGRGATQVTIDLDELRDGLEKYLKEFADSREFPRALPPIENKELSVVALVQDDTGKRVLDAVLVRVPEKP